MPEELCRNQSILRFDVILQDDWSIEQCPLHISVFFGGKTKRPCCGLFIHWLIKQNNKEHLLKPVFKVMTKIALSRIAWTQPKFRPNCLADRKLPLQLIYFNYSCYFIDRLVLIGNHRDAWVFGGIDPSSGTACMMEVAKALGQKYKQGRKQTFFKLCLRFSVLLREDMAPGTRTAQLCSRVDIYHVSPSAWQQECS